MRWSFEIARVFGIPIKVHITFILLLVFVALAGGGEGRQLAGLSGVILICLVFVCVVLHELGHSVVALHYGLKVRSITLLPIGGVASMDDMPDEPMREVAIAAAGPLVSVGLAVAFYVLAVLTHNIPNVEEAGFFGSGMIHSLFFINVAITVFNLIPAFPLDGGRVLRGLLATTMHPLKATHIAVSIGQAFAIVFFFLGIFYNIFLALIALFIYIGGEGEERACQLRMSLMGVPASDVMLTNVEVVSPDDTLGAVLERVFHSAQEDFPVVENDALVGLLPRNKIIAAAHEQPKTARVRDFMETEFSPVPESAPLSDLVRRMMAEKIQLVPVVRGDTLAGLINMEQIAKHQMFCFDPSLKSLLD